MYADINYLSIIPVKTVEKIADSDSLEFEDITELLLRPCILIFMV
jgi:hypothetical protein